jgi:Holliday junction resolvasome RuvABC endonuclease subunit
MHTTLANPRHRSGHPVHGNPILGRRNAHPPHGESHRQRAIATADAATRPRSVVRLIDDLEPNIVAVERTFFNQNRHTALLNVLFDEIRSLARRKRLAFVSYAPATIKKFICGNGSAGKKQVATVVVSKFPELKVYLSQDRAWKERFHQNMFDAAALGIMVTVKPLNGSSLPCTLNGR